MIVVGITTMAMGIECSIRYSHYYLIFCSVVWLATRSVWLRWPSAVGTRYVYTVNNRRDTMQYSIILLMHEVCTDTQCSVMLFMYKVKYM